MSNTIKSFALSGPIFGFGRDSATLSLKEFCEFYRFWAWKYTERNIEFQGMLSKRDWVRVFWGEQQDFFVAGTKELIFEIIDKFGDNSIDCHLHTIASMCGDQYAGPPNTSMPSYSSDDILMNLMSGDKLVRPFRARWFPFNTRTHDYNPARSDKPLMSKYGLELAPGDLLLTINMNGPLEVILSEISRAYTYYRDVRVADGYGGFDTGFHGEASLIKSNKDISFEVDDFPRAVGLWLWDYIEKEVGQHPPGGRWLAKAIAALKEKFDMAKLGYDKSEKETFRKLYRRTNACIEAAEVLSLK